MQPYIYSASVLTAVHRAMWTPLLLTLDIGGGRGNACEREEVLTSVLQKRRLTNELFSKIISKILRSSSLPFVARIKVKSSFVRHPAPHAASPQPQHLTAAVV